MDAVLDTHVGLGVTVVTQDLKLSSSTSQAATGGNPVTAQYLLPPEHGRSMQSSVEDMEESAPTLRCTDLLRKGAPQGHPDQAEERAFPSDSGFSRHDSLFSFGASSTRNAAELKSFLGSSNSRLKPGATVLPLHGGAMDKNTAGAHAVSLEQAKARARVEVDIVLENDCCVEGGYLRGSLKLRVRKRHKKEAHVLLADGKLRVIGFESIPGEPDRHAFYQRASSLCAVTDGYNRIYDSPADSEGFARAMEGVHVLPFAMHLPADCQLGSARGSPCLQSGVSIRYIAMVSVKVKESKTGKRSIAHFYRDCQIWPRLDRAIVLSNAPRPIQASTTGSLSVIGTSKKIKLTAMLPRMTWLAGQRCYVHLSVMNETKKTVKSLRLALVRTTTLFKPMAALNAGNSSSVDPNACQTATTHKVIAESTLERSQGLAKGHASAQGWWSGVPAGQDAQFAHYILINPDALSVARARLIEVEYSIQISLSAGALASDVQVTLPIRIVNFLSLDPLPSAPLLSVDGSYARLVGREDTGEIDPACLDTAATENEGQDWAMPHARDTTVPAPANSNPSCGRKIIHSRTADDICETTGGSSSDIYAEDPCTCPPTTALHVTNPDMASREASFSEGSDSGIAYASASDSSLYSAASFISASDSSTPPPDATGRPSTMTFPLGNLDLPDGADMGDEVDAILQSMPFGPGSGVAVPTPHELDGLLLESHRYEAASHISNASADEGATPPARLARTAPTPGSPASLRDSSVRADAHRRPANPHRSRSNPVPEPAFAQRTADGTDPSSVTAGPRSRPARPERSPLRARTGTWGPRQPEGTLPDGMTSFERRVQEKKRALLDAHTGGEPAHAQQSTHPREPAQCDAPGASGIGDEDCEETPRLGSSGAARGVPIGRTAPQDEAVADSGSRMRGSRQLPLPPPCSSDMAISMRGEIPASVSAFDSLRESRARTGAALSTGIGCVAGLPAMEHYPAGPPPLVPSTSSSSSSERSTSHYGQRTGVLPSTSGLGLHHRPIEGLRSTGSSDSSIVKGRIAVFEERLKVSYDNGAAYA